MKKSKLLSFSMAMVLVLSLGSCSDTYEEETPNDTELSDSNESSNTSENSGGRFN